MMDARGGSARAELLSDRPNVGRRRAVNHPHAVPIRHSAPFGQELRKATSKVARGCSVAGIAESDPHYVTEKRLAEQGKCGKLA